MTLLLAPSFFQIPASVSHLRPIADQRQVGEIRRSLEEGVRHYESLSAYIEYYNEDGLHGSLDIDNYQTPLREFSDKKITKAIREGNPNRMEESE